ncbi:MAG: M23 family metallopeptidase [Acidobacteria bacterium]|nr:M23 family metallopeptidase [Acidobacteriota bacterium]
MTRASRIALLLVLLAATCACLARRPPVSGPTVEPAPQAPQAPAAQPPPAPPRTYEVRPGDTLFSIARAHGVSVDDLVRANRIENPDRIYAGQVLVVPGADADALAGSGVAEIPAPAGPAEPEVPAFTGEGSWSWPVDGQVLSHFGKRGKGRHSGIDIAAENGAPVRAAAAGRVAYSGRQRGYGLMVIVVHDNGYTSLYAHVRRVLVRPGQKVRQGAKLAEVGRTGNASGCHLHFEIRLDDRPLDPLVLLAS